MISFYFPSKIPTVCINKQAWIASINGRVGQQCETGPLAEGCTGSCCWPPPLPLDLAWSALAGAFLNIGTQSEVMSVAIATAPTESTGQRRNRGAWECGNQPYAHNTHMHAHMHAEKLNFYRIWVGWLSTHYFLLLLCFTHSQVQVRTFTAAAAETIIMKERERSSGRSSICTSNHPATNHVPARHNITHYGLYSNGF